MTLRALAFAGRTSLAVNTDSVLAAYSDNSSVASWAKEPIAELMSSGIMNGMGAAKIAPKSLATRAQTVTILKQALQSIKFINE